MTDRIDSDRVRAGIEEATSALEGLREAVAALSTDAVDLGTWQEWSARSGVLLAGFDHGCSEVNDSLGLTSTHERLLIFMQVRIGENVRKEELRGVAAILEWARRLRELRRARLANR